MAHRILFEDDIVDLNIKEVNTLMSNENISIKEEEQTDKQENKNSNKIDQNCTIIGKKTAANEINDNIINLENNNYDRNTDQTELNSKIDQIGKSDQTNSKDHGNSDQIFEVPIENCNDDQEVGKSDQSSVYKGKGKKRPSELELLGVKIKEDNDTVDSFDVYGDENQIFRKYKLRKTELQVSYKEPPDIKAVRFDSDDEKPKIKEEESPLQCSVCKLEFESKRAVHVHARTHDNVTEYNCSLCQKKFTTNKDLIAHKTTHTLESFLCTICKLAFSDHCDYLLHNYLHLKHSNFTCAECGVTYSIGSYKTHVLTHFDKKLSCHLCSFVTNGEINLRAHIKRHNSQLKCVECGKICKDKKMFDYHLASHTGVKKYQCLYCGKCFSHISQRAIHSRAHSDDRPFTCDICGRKFRQSTDLKRHKEIHENKRYPCDLCNKTYMHKNYLVTHRRRHTKESLYECPECDGKFVSPGGLKCHIMYKHMSERPVECKLCDRKFINYNQLMKHSRSKYHKRAVFGHMMKKENGDE